MSTLDFIAVGADRGEADCLVLWMHGLGADGSDFVPIVPELNLPKELRCRFIFPHAAVRPVTINAGMEMRAWYDIIGLSFVEREDKEGIFASAQAICALLDEEYRHGIRPEKTIFAGFSQGGAMALHLGLTYPKKIAGIMALSTYLPLRQHLADHKHEVNQHVPIFMAHGSFDPVVPYIAGQMSQDVLVNNGYEVDWHEYPMMHQVCAEEIVDIGKWLGKHLG
jgi:phospholipase/carboxylesterase